MEEETQVKPFPTERVGYSEGIVGQSLPYYGFVGIGNHPISIKVFVLNLTDNETFNIFRRHSCVTLIHASLGLVIIKSVFQEAVNGSDRKSVALNEHLFHTRRYALGEAVRRESAYFILVKGDIRFNVPVETLMVNGIELRCHFKSFVHHMALVRPHIDKAVARRDGGTLQ